MLEKIVPIPPEFYDDHKDEDLITGKGTIFPFAVFLYFMQWAAFLGFILFYWYHPSSQVTQSKMENNYDYGKASGWNCTPLLNDPFYKSRMNYETCKAIMIKPKLDDIKTMKINIDPDCIETDDNNCTQATAFRFMPFKGSEGLTGRRGVVQPGSLIENTFDSTNTDAIKAELKKIFEPLAAEHQMLRLRHALGKQGRLGRLSREQAGFVRHLRRPDEEEGRRAGADASRRRRRRRRNATCKQHRVLSGDGCCRARPHVQADAAHGWSSVGCHR